MRHRPATQLELLSDVLLGRPTARCQSMAGEEQERPYGAQHWVSSAASALPCASEQVLPAVRARYVLRPSVGARNY